MGNQNDGTLIIFKDVPARNRSTSRWLVGSSSSRMSGFASRRRQRATRRRSPPESLETSESLGGQRRASIAISRVRSRSQPLAASMRSCSSPCSARSSVISSSVIGSANLPLISLKRARSSTIEPQPSITLPRTSFSGLSCGSCSR